MTRQDRTTTPTRRARWAAIGAAVAVSLGAGGFGIASATIGSGERAVFVPITPCRVMDTRPAPDTVGSRAVPLGPAETHTIAVVGVSGNCNLPVEATGVVMNVTAVGPTQPSFLTVFPSGVTRPLASNLNFVDGQAPTPNAVTVDVPANGQVSFYNHAGTVNVLADIVGYYADHNHDDRYYTKTEVDGALSGKANSSDVYTKTEVDGALAGKANSSDVYTKTEVDGALSGKANAPLVQTGTSSNDPFVNFLGAPLALDDYCGDVDGCRVTLIRELGGTRYLYGPITFQIAGNQWWTFAGGAGGSAADGTSSNGAIQNILGNSSATTECFLSDWDTSGNTGNGDQNGNFSVIRLNTTATPQTCTIKVED